jgi:pSer/pThr/pTyr-binding forkhead associated (FHA) protein
MSNEPAVPTSTELTSTINLSSLRAVSEIGVGFESLSTEEREVLSALPEASAMLIGLSGPGKGARFLLNVAQTSIGRTVTSEIFLDDVTVSRKHAVVERSDGSNYLVRDMGSLNGTYLNGEAVKESGLNSGDEIQIGKFKLTFFVKEGTR